MKVTQTNIDDLNAKLSVEIEKADYLDKFNAELSKLKSKVQLKGFRKGKTPINTVRKMYGQSVLAEAVNETLQKALSDHIVDTNLDLLGQPLPSEDDPEIIEFNPNSLQDYTFNFDVGISPALEVQGVSDSDAYPIKKVEVEDSVVMEELTMATKRLGERVSVTEDIKEEDILQVHALELDADGNLVDKGWDTGFSVMVDMLNDDTKKEVLGLKAGESFDFDIYTLEKDKDEKYVKKYLLNLDEEEEKEIGNQFRGTIKDVTRLVPAEINEDFLNKFFGEGVASTEEEAKEKIKENISAYYDDQAKRLMYRDIMDVLIEKNEVPLPEAFLKRWIAFNNEKLSSEEIDKDFEGFAKNLKWTLISSNLAKKYDVKVEQEDIHQRFVQQAQSYLGQYGADPSLLNGIVENLMKNQEQVNRAYEEVQADKVFGKIAEVVTQTEESVSVEEFNELVKQLNERLKG